MRFPAGKNWTKHLAGVAVATIAALWLAPAARAECGHYVTFSKQAKGELPSSAQTATMESQKPARQDAPTGPRPCSGPLCSAAPAAPSATTVPPSSSPERDPLQGLLTFLHTDRHDTVGAHVEEEHSLPVRLSSSIFHPPPPF